MENNSTLQNKQLAQVSGGNEPIFQGNTVLCPTCGHRPLKLVSSDEFTDTYKCEVCGKIWIHTKKEHPKIHPGLICPRCGDRIPNWTLLSTAGGMDRIRCGTCQYELSVPSEG